MRQFILAFLLSLLATGLSFAHDYQLGDLVISAPWTRATPPGAKTGGGYLVITNKGNAGDRLVAVKASAVSDNVQIHEMAMNGTVMSMKALPDGIVIPAGGKVEFKPGGYHIMFIDLKAGLKQGDHVHATLQFEHAGTVDVDFDIGGIGQTMPMHHDMPM